MTVRMSLPAAACVVLAHIRGEPWSLWKILTPSLLPAGHQLSRAEGFRGVRAARSPIAGLLGICRRLRVTLSWFLQSSSCCSCPGTAWCWEVSGAC